MRLDVPYTSQYLDIADPYWKDRSCSVACLRMVLSMRGDVPTLETLVLEGKDKYGYDPSRGWTHKAIVSLFSDYGILAQSREFKEEGLFEKGVEEIVNSLDQGNPVLISAVKNFQEEKKFHTVLFVGYEKDTKGEVSGFYYHDPAFDDREKGQNLFVPFETFKKYWRRMAIFLFIGKGGG